ncbi:MAG: hypothetical protein AseanaTS_19170 [Candidatus Pelagadaptatus aseana]|uniref:DUF4404 family protein n=1 Tax=Candidatus Pelagadaptatus aseana TaxID=3120508 RepID=UPI0039B27852
MTNDALKANIAEIRTIMETALASKERDLLGDLLSTMLDKPEPVVPDEHDTLVQQIDSAAVDFEMDHPQLARALREVGDSLNKMGV